MEFRVQNMTFHGSGIHLASFIPVKNQYGVISLLSALSHKGVYPNSQCIANALDNLNLNQESEISCPRLVTHNIGINAGGTSKYSEVTFQFEKNAKYRSVYGILSIEEVFIRSHEQIIFVDPSWNPPNMIAVFRGRVESRSRSKIPTSDLLERL